MSMATVYRVKRLGQARFVVQFRPPWWASFCGLFGWDIAPTSSHYREEDDAYRHMAWLMREDGYTDLEIEKETGVKL